MLFQTSAAKQADLEAALREGRREAESHAVRAAKATAAR
jgi:hypothetical protein